MKRLSLGFNMALGAMACFLLSQASAYTFGDAYWHDHTMTYRINPANQDVSETAAINAIKYGASAWPQQAQTNLTPIYGGTTSVSSVGFDGTNAIFFRNTSSPDGVGVVATTYTFWTGADEMVEADMVFWDGSSKFFTGSSGCSSGYYIEDIATHEFGHFYGLEHSSVSDATMYPSTLRCSTTQRTLASDDIAGIRAIYGVASPTPTPTPPPTIVAPTNLVAKTGTTVGSIILTWTDKSNNEDGFQIFRSTTATGTFSKVGTVGVNVKTFTNKSLTSKKRYYYKVRAYKGTTTSSFSNTANALAK